MRKKLRGKNQYWKSQPLSPGGYKKGGCHTVLLHLSVSVDGKKLDERNATNVFKK